MYRVWNYISAYSLLLILGAATALIWANSDPQGYHAFVHYVLIDDFVIGEPFAEGKTKHIRQSIVPYKNH